jgi:hypothetical protein
MVKQGKLSCTSIDVDPLPRKGYYVLTIGFSCRAPAIEDDIDAWWKNEFGVLLGRTCIPQFARASRPGYFIRRWGPAQAGIDFEIRCPDPKCELNKIEWHEVVPGINQSKVEHSVPAPFEIPTKTGYAFGVPISAYTVDDQVYHRCPSMVIATVDKFARLAYERQCIRYLLVFPQEECSSGCWWAEERRND